jgi:hypothetical protein
MLSETIATASVGSLPPTLPQRIPDLPATRLLPEQRESEATNRLREVERERDLLRAHVAIIEQQKHSLETRLAAIENDYFVRMARKLRRLWRSQ